MIILHVFNAACLIFLFLESFTDAHIVSSATYRVLETTIHHATRITHFQRSTLQVFYSEDKRLIP